VADPKPLARIGFSDPSLTLTIEVDANAVPRIVGLGASPVGSAGLGVPLVDVVVTGEGRAWSGHRYCESVVGARLRYLGHDEQADPDGRWRILRVNLRDFDTGLRAVVSYQILAGGGSLRSSVTLTNDGPRPVIVEAVTSLLAGALPNADDLDVLWADHDWLAENRWQRRDLRSLLPDLNRSQHERDPRGCFGRTNTGTWSSEGQLPMGALVDRRSGHAWAWQIEHNGGWHWQVGEHTKPAGEQPAATYLALLGPTDTEHQCRTRLAPGESLHTVPVALAVGDDLDDALGQLTDHRRATRRRHDDHERLPVVFNDYMNTLMGDPTTDRLLPLIAAAASVGAEYFCIDAGWYAERDEHWWDTVGAWQPSESRFPNGIGEVLDHIRAAGMVPGLWLEPEVIGVRSPIVARLPSEAFFTRDGLRVVEHDRYHLDFRHPAVRKHLDEVVDFLVGDLGVGYFKLDYNINAGPGTDLGGSSAGAGLLEHNRAHLDWLDGVLDRHPGLTIENCASGGMRMDYALLSRLQLQSTSDQQDFLRYAAIAAGAPAAVTPEQCAVWAYPQPEFTDDAIAFNLCNALLGRIHLSGHLDRMTATQRDLVAEGIEVYRSIRADLAKARPFWPLGLPGWTDPRLVLGMRTPTVTYLTVWHRTTTSAHDLAIPLPHLAGTPVHADIRYPHRTGRAEWRQDEAQLLVTLPRTPSACLIELRQDT
jgi:alpha-galactosidase